MTRSRKFLTCALAVASILSAAAVVGPIVAAPKAAVYTGLIRGVAVGGYDPVAYFTEGKPVPGRSEITVEHQGATWRFASEANRDSFRADPAKYAPQYGGYCAWAVSEGYTAKGDPKAWRIVDGKLYLNYDASVQRTWEKNIPGNIARGDANWPKLTAGN